jgi:transposase, IS30 family
MAYSHLTYGDRIHIGVLVQQGKGATQIAEEVGKHRSSIYRELGRNRSSDGYFPDTANIHSINRKVEAASIPRIDEDRKEWVEEKLLLQWSPEQISNRMELELGESVSHEWIYQMVYADRKDGGTLHLNLRWGRRTRKKRGGGRDKRGQIPNRVSIEKRPEIINERGRIGDFEGDLIIGAHHKGMLLTLVDRASRYTLIEKLINKTAEVTAKATVNSLEGLSGDKHSITFDNGKEFSDHEQISKEAGIPIFFAHPYSSYERGTNENTNGLIRQYFPKKYDLRKTSSKEVKKVQNLLNHRPREILGYKTPHEFHFGESLQYFTSQ